MLDLIEISKRRTDKLDEVWKKLDEATRIAIEEAKACKNSELKRKLIDIASFLVEAKSSMNDVLEIESESLTELAKLSMILIKEENK